MKQQYLIWWLAVSLFLFYGTGIAFSQTEFWQQTNGPSGYGPYTGQVFSLAINSSGNIFAGCYGGVFRSTDNGESWSPTALTDYNVGSLTTNLSGHIFAGAIEIYPGLDSRVFRSTNNGASWTDVGFTDTSYVRSFAINSKGYVFAGTYYRGVFRSTDNGESWRQINTGLTDTQVVALAINSHGHLFAGTSYYGGGVFRSTDSGESWSRTGLRAPITALAVNPDGHIFAAESGFNPLILRSTDNGESWRQVNSGFNTYCLSINSSRHIFAGGAGGVLRSTDNGGNWVQVNTGLTNRDVRSLAINSSGYIFAGTYGSGVFRSMQSTTSVKEIDGEMPIVFSLQQNSPNPFNPSTMIEFALPRASSATLKVYNMLGEEVATLVSENLSAGKYKVEWNANGFASGAYFYRLQSSGFIETRKLTLLR